MHVFQFINMYCSRKIVVQTIFTPQYFTQLSACIVYKLISFYEGGHELPKPKSPEIRCLDQLFQNF